MASENPQLEREIEPILKSITFEHIERFSDLMNMKEEIGVYIKINDREINK